MTDNPNSQCANPQPGNVNFNYEQLMYIWDTAGGNNQVAAVAAAIAMAESGGNSGATDCDSNGTIDRGLWQINSVHGTMSTYDVMGNARAAISISNNGGDWSAWTTYKNGAYRQFINPTALPSQTPINATNAQAGQGGTDATLTGAYGIPGLPSQLDPSWWAGQAGSAIRGAILGLLNPVIQVIAGVMGVTAGGVIVLLGIFVLVSQSRAGREAAQVGMMAVPGVGEEEAAAGAAGGAAKAAAPATRTTYTASQRRSPFGEPLRTMRVTTRTGTETHTVSTPQVLRNQAWEYYTPPKEGPKTASGRPGFYIK